MKRFLYLFLFLAFCIPSLCQAQSPVSASLFVQNEKVAAGKSFYVVLRTDLEKGWHVYWRTSGDAGEPTVLNLDLPDGFTVEEFLYPYPKKFMTGPFTEYGYDGEAFVIAKIKAPVTAQGRVFLTGTARWLACKGECRPGEAAVSTAFDIGTPTTEDNAAVARALEKVPHAADAVFWRQKDGVLLGVRGVTKAAGARYFPYGDVIRHGAEQPFVFQNGTAYLTLTLPKGKTADAMENLSGTVVFYDGRDKPVSAVEINAVPSVSPFPVFERSFDWTGLLWGVVLAFFGGLLLNLMPCVFPVLSLKAYALLRVENAHRREEAIAYTAGVLCTFLMSGGVLTLLRRAGEGLGWGFQMQYPPFVLLMTVLLFVLGLVFSGVVSVGENVPAFCSRFDGRWGAFGTGLLAVVVATPCAAPFMGVALGYALTAPAMATLVVFVAMGAGLAVPFLILGFVPRLGRLLPKSGAWTETLREFLAFPLYGAAAWLIWVLTVQEGAFALATVLAVLVFVALTAWASEQKTGKLCSRAVRLVCVVLTIAAFVALMPEREETRRGAALDWKPYEITEIQRLRNNNVPVFVKFSASWCLTCLLNEKTTLETDLVKEAFREKGVATFVGDWTTRNDTVTTVLDSFGRGGIPLYLYYPPNAETPVVLPQILTPATVTELLSDL